MKNKASLFGISLKRTALKLRGHLYHTVFLAFRLLSCGWTCLIVFPGGFSLSCCVSLLHTSAQVVFHYLVVCLCYIPLPRWFFIILLCVIVTYLCPGGFSLSCCVSLLHSACVVHPKKGKTVSFQASLHGLFYNRTTLNGTPPFSLETTDCLKLTLSRPSTSWKPSTGMAPL